MLEVEWAVEWAEEWDNLVEECMLERRNTPIAYFHPRCSTKRRLAHYQGFYSNSLQVLR